MSAARFALLSLRCHISRKETLFLRRMFLTYSSSALYSVFGVSVPISFSKRKERELKDRGRKSALTSASPCSK